MYCTSCGTPRPDGATACPGCGRPYQIFGAPPQPAGGPQQPASTIPNYLVQSILVTFCCCLPFGIVAIVYAAQVNSKLAAGDVAGALAASNNAKMWSWIAFGVGLLMAVGYYGLVGLGTLTNHAR
jgi:Interferon-induced transmembrane protein